MPISDRDFGRLEEKVDTILENQRAAVKSREDIDLRMRGLETKNAYSTGRQSVISAIVAAVIAGIMSFFGRHYS